MPSCPDPDFIFPDFQQGIDIGMGHSVSLPGLVLEVGEMVACFYDMENPGPRGAEPNITCLVFYRLQYPIMGWGKRSEPFREKKAGLLKISIQEV